MSDIYWAADETKKCCQGALARRKDFREWLTRTGRIGRIQRSLRAYYGYTPTGDGDTSIILSSGEQGEIADLAVNHFAALVRQALVLITSDRAAFKAVAGNTDYRSLAQAALADGLLEHYDRKLNVSDIEGSAAFRALLMGEGYVSVTWDPDAGDLFGQNPETGQPVREGDLLFRCFSPLEVAYDITATQGRRPWFLLQTRRMKWDIVAQYPELKDDILAAHDERDEYSWVAYTLDPQPKSNDDQATVFELFVPPSPAVPQGRLVIFLNSDTVLFDGPLPYDGIPVYGMTPDETIGVAAGHTSTFDLLGMQQALDMCSTIATTNLQAGGVVNFWAPAASDLNVRQISGGMNFITSPVKPEAMNGVAMSPEVLRWGSQFVAWMQQISGINSAVRGDPDSGMPAQAMAFLQAQAVQFHSGLQRGFQRMREQVRSANIELLKRFANSKRVALITGKATGYMRKEFSADDLSDIERVSVEAVNPALRTMAGRKAVADELLQRGLIQQPQQYILLLTTGKLEPMFEGEEANLLRIRRNRELLQQGIGLPPVAVDDSGRPMVDLETGMAQFADDGEPHVRPLQTDTHWLDIPEYASVLAMPDARERPAVIQAVTDVIKYQMALWRQMDPLLVQVLKGYPAPPPAAAPMPTPPALVGGGPLADELGTGPTLAGPPISETRPDINLPQLPRTPTGDVPPIVGVNT
jgi:hypothetical protein